MGTIKTWWPKTPAPGNTGDLITPLILSLLGHSPEHSSRAGRGCLLGCGSIARFSHDTSVVWGSGIMRHSDPVASGAEWLMVRGPHTRDAVDDYGDAPPYMCDPGLCMPPLYPLPHRATKGHGICLHYCEVGDQHIRNTALKQCEHIGCRSEIFTTLYADPREFIKKICTYSLISSSSLHGVILAHAYGIPARWIRVSDRLSGDGVKFDDYFQTVELSAQWDGAKYAPVKNNMFQLPERNAKTRGEIGLDILKAWLEKQSGANHG